MWSPSLPFGPAGTQCVAPSSGDEHLVAAVHEVGDEQDDEQLEVPRRLLVGAGVAVAVAVIRVIRGVERGAARRAGPLGGHGRRRPVALAVVAPGHQLLLLRTRSFSGVDPKSNASRIERSR